MAINLEDTYPGKVNPATPAWPFGQPKNIVTPGDGTGTPWEQAIIRDTEGFKQALLTAAGLTPSGTPDTAEVSQYLQAFSKISGRLAATVADASLLDNLTDGTEVFTLGRFAMGDGGHAKYRFRSAGGGGNDGVAFIDHGVSGDLQLLPENGELNALAGGAVVAPADSSAAVLACITAANANGWRLVFPGKTFKFTVVSTVPCEIECRPGFLVEPNAAGDVAALRFNGVASGTAYQMTGSAVRNQKTITTTVAAADLSDGSYFVLQDDKARASDAAKEINMEVHRAVDVTGTSITLDDFVRDQKDVTATNIYKITMCAGIVVRGWNYVGVAGSIANSGLYFDMCRNVRVYGVKGRSTAAPGASFQRCHDVEVYDWDFAEPQSVSSGQGYGLAFGRGTTKIHIGAGVGNGMRHAVDFDSAWDITSDWFDCLNGVNSGDVLIGHNGWGGDVQSLKFRARGGLFQSLYIGLPATAGATVYTREMYNVNAEVDAQLVNTTGGEGFKSNQRLINSRIKVKTVHGDGSKPTSAVSQVYGVSMVANLNKGTEVEVDCKGATAAVFTADGSTSGFGDAVYNVTAVNCYNAVSFNSSQEVNIQRLDADNIHSTVIDYTGSATLRKFNIGEASLKNLNAGITNVTSAKTAAMGTVGHFNAIYDDQNDGTLLSIAAGNQLTMDQILGRRNGKTLHLTAAGAVTTGDPFLPFPIFTGQRVVLVNTSSNSITIPNSATMQNDGGASVVIGTAKRTVEYEGSVIGSTGTWYQVG